MDKAIFHQFSDAGLREIVSVMGYLDDVSYNFVKLCNHVHRSHYILEEVFYALYVEMIALWMKTISEPELQTFSTLEDIDSEIAQELFSSFDQWRKDTAKGNKIFKLWGELFFDSMVTSCASWDSQRVGNWALYMSSIKAGSGFLELFYSWNRHYYAESVTEFLRDVSCLSSYHQSLLDKGIAFCNRTGTALNQVSVGYALEMAHKDLKSSTKRLDVDGLAWHRVHSVMPFLLKAKGLVNNIFGIGESLREHEKHIPDPKSISELRRVIQKGVLNIDGERQSFSEIKEDFTRWCDDQPLQDQFLSSKSLGLDRVVQVSRGIIEGGVKGSVSEVIATAKSKSKSWTAINVIKRVTNRVSKKKQVMSVPSK